DLDNVDKLSKALELTGRIARESDAEVIYAGVVDVVPTSSKRSHLDQALERLKTFAAAQAETYGIRAKDHVALRGDLHLNVGSDIIKAASEAECDLIVMASHMPGLKEHFLASNAGYVASHAPMSVYVVR
ncbi:MAG: universal stress protein, partial [Pseudomonadota bacterium]